MIKGFKKRRQKGALFIEAALVLPFLIYLVVNMIYFAFFLHDYMCLNNMTRNSVRLAAVERSTASQGTNTQGTASQGDTEVDGEEQPTASMQARLDTVKAYLNGGIADELLIYNLKVSEIKAQNRPEKIETSGGYIFTSELDAKGEKKLITVVLAADRTNDYPLIVDQTIPKVIVSSLKMKLEE